MRVDDIYQPIAPVTNMVNSLGWETLETRRLRARLTMLYKIKNNLIAIPLPAIVTTPLRSTPRQPHEFHDIYASTESYKNNFFIQPVKEWESTTSVHLLQGQPTLFQGCLGFLLSLIDHYLAFIP